MALSVTSAPWQQVNEPALDLRRQLGVGRNEGAVGTNDMAISQRAAGANMSVDVAAGEALVAGDSITNQGLYYVYNDAVLNVTGFAAANATNPRIDRVVLRIQDAFHGDAANSATIEVLTGTATAGATLVNLTGAAAVGNNRLLLANVLVPATATTITTANIDTTVRTVGAGAYRAYTPVWSSSGTQPAIGNGTITGRYTQVGKFVHFYMQVTLGSTSTFGTGTYVFTLPVTSIAGLNNVPLASVWANDSSGAVFNTAAGIPNTTTQFVIQYPATWPTGALAQYNPTTPWTWAQSDYLVVSGQYEAA